METKEQYKRLTRNGRCKMNIAVSIYDAMKRFISNGRYRDEWYPLPVPGELIKSSDLLDYDVLLRDLQVIGVLNISYDGVKLGGYLKKEWFSMNRVEFIQELRKILN